MCEILGCWVEQCDWAIWVVGLTSVGVNIRLGYCHVGCISGLANVYQTSSIGCRPVSLLFVWVTACSGKCPFGHCLIRICPWGSVCRVSVLSGYSRWCSGYHYCTASFNWTWTQALRRFKPCSQRVGDSRWWGSLTVVPAVSKTKRLSSVNRTTKAIRNLVILWCLEDETPNKWHVS